MFPSSVVPWVLMVFSLHTSLASVTLYWLFVFISVLNEMKEFLGAGIGAAEVFVSDAFIHFVNDQSMLTK